MVVAGDENPCDPPCMGDVGQGVGLGLALTYNIVKRHGGEIRLESRIDEGSQFTLLLPIWREET